MGLLCRAPDDSPELPYRGGVRLFVCGVAGHAPDRSLGVPSMFAAMLCVCCFSCLAKSLEVAQAEIDYVSQYVSTSDLKQWRGCVVGGVRGGDCFLLVFMIYSKVAWPRNAL